MWPERHFPELQLSNIQLYINVMPMNGNLCTLDLYLAVRLLLARDTLQSSVLLSIEMYKVTLPLKDFALSAMSFASWLQRQTFEMS